MLWDQVKKILANLNFWPNFRVYALKPLENLQFSQNFGRLELLLIILKLYFNKSILFQDLYR